MQTARAGRTLLHQAMAVFIAAAGYHALTSHPALAATDETKAADESAPEAQKLPPNQLAAKELKTFKSPFNTAAGQSAEASTASQLSDLKLTSAPATERPRRLDLSQRLLAPQLFLPGRMVLGKTAEFTIKGKPGSWAVLAMADKDTGAKPIMGHNIRLGPDRKVVAAGQIPASGLLCLDIETPIEGDLIGQYLYFEAALWSKPDMTDVDIVAVVPSESQPDAANGVLISAETSDKKRGLRIVPNTSGSMMSRSQTDGATTLESGKP